MPPSKRRKGKHASSRSTATRQSSAAAAAAAQAGAAENNNSSNQASQQDPTADNNNDDQDNVAPTEMSWIEDENDLVLTSAKRRGVYECDYCHGDISQLPRIRCAVCDDFDLCLDCFTANVGLNQTAAAAASASGSGSKSLLGRKSAAAAAVAESGATAAGSKAHSPTKHGYRVCDSTRFPIFPTAKQWSTKAFMQSVAANTAAVAAAAEQAATPVGATAKDGEGGKEGEDSQRTQSSETASPMEIDQEGGEQQGDDSSKKVEASSPDAPKKPPAATTPVATTPAASTPAAWSAAGGGNSSYMFRADDPKLYWTVEEDLRLLEGIQNHGIGNWVEIAETVAGQGSVGKTPKRCMERYLDDYLGRYGHILPPYTLIPYEENATEEDATLDTSSVSAAAAAGEGDASSTGGGATSRSSTPAPMDSMAMDDVPSRASKRRAVRGTPLSGTASSTGGGVGGGVPSHHSSTLASRKRYKIVHTESIEGYNSNATGADTAPGSVLWPDPYFPSKDTVQGAPVGRDQICKAEQAYVKLIASASSDAEVAAICKEWTETKLGQPNGPTVLPPRPEDVMAMSGAELAGFMPRRGDFDIEWENDAEEAIGDMEFLPGDSEEDKQLKLKVLAIYNSKLDQREARKKFIISRKLWDYRKLHHEFEKLPRDERDLVHRMRLFERFHTPHEHKLFLDDILKAKRLRKEIAKLQMYRRLGIRTMVEAEQYELDKARRQFHKAASAGSGGSSSNTNKDGDGGSSKRGGAGGAGNEDAADRKSLGGAAGGKAVEDTASTSLWRQYRTSDRRVRKSVNRGASFETTASSTASAGGGNTSDGGTAKAEPAAAAAPPAAAAPAAASVAATAGESGEPSVTLVPTGAGNVKPAPLPVAPSVLLSRPEVELCQKVGLTQEQYREVKKVLIQESLNAGLLDKEGAGSSRRTLIKMDVDRRGNLIDFFLRAGWVSTRLSHIARTLPQTQLQL